ncbi:MAG: DUF1850 domain-containing protein [Clostridiales Family XIII bacterium]|nr:DUF1850 domain-containing protein [Clostridiales Family XIII bacterium]
MVAAAFAVAALLGLFAVFSDAGEYALILGDAEGEGVFAEIAVRPGDNFSVTFVHSVNNSPVTDVYEVREPGIRLVETRYYAFGAGVPSELEPGQSLSYAEDGAMVVSGIDKEMRDLIYVVGTVSDHVMEIGGEEISLRELCGRNSAVRFSVARS